MRSPSDKMGSTLEDRDYGVRRCVRSRFVRLMVLDLLVRVEPDRGKRRHEVSSYGPLVRSRASMRVLESMDRYRRRRRSAGGVRHDCGLEMKREWRVSPAKEAMAL